MWGGGPRVVVSTAAFHARVRGSVPGHGGLKETKNDSSPSRAISFHFILHTICGYIISMSVNTMWLCTYDMWVHNIYVCKYDVALYIRYVGT